MFNEQFLLHNGIFGEKIYFTGIFKQSTVVGYNTMKTTFDFNFDLYVFNNIKKRSHEKLSIKKILFDYL